MDLVKGQNVGLPVDAAVVEFSIESGGQRGAGVDLDLCALQLGASRQVLSDAAFVFYNQPRSPDGALELSVSGGRQRLKFALPIIDSACSRVAIALSVDDGAGSPVPFDRAPDFALHGWVGESELIFRYQPVVLSVATAVILGEIYRFHGAWKFRAVGQSHDDGLAGIARDFGVDVEASDPANGVARESSSGATISQSPRPPARAVVPARLVSGTGGQCAAMTPRPMEQGQGASAPTLSMAASVWNAVQDTSAEVLQVHYESIQDAARAMGAAEQSLDVLFLQADSAAAALRRTLRSSFDTDAMSTSGDEHIAPLTRWIVKVGVLRDEIATTRVPLTRTNRDRKKFELAQRAGNLLAAQSSSEMATLFKHHATMSAVTNAAFREVIGRHQDRLNNLVATTPALPAVVDSLTADATRDAPPIAGYGPPLVRVGTIRPSAVDVLGRAPHAGRYSSEIEDNHRWETTATWEVPALLDMSTIRGVVTNQASIVNNILLKLVSLLPAGQFTMTLFDPVKLGDNAKFIFGLGDSASHIIGDKVRSTDRELADILVGLEEHLGFVTQKYLQGQYDSLSDYNEAAGEVAEPYRALVLYDFPSGFVRAGGHADEEMLNRLSKIIGSGMRCGVMTFVTRQSADFSTDSPVAQLYPLFSGVEMGHWLARNLASAIAADVEPVDLSVPVPGWSQAPLQQAARKPGTTLFRSSVQARYHFVPEAEPAPAVVAALLAGVERGLSQAADVRVSLEQVSRLAISKLDREVVKGTRVAETLPLPSEESTWWHGSSADGISGVFGRVGATDLGQLELDSQIASGALIGGRMGSGKSVLLHAIILSLVTRYSPDELSLYLVDFKEGVEFKAYAAESLPHATVVAVESEREFGLSVLKSLDAEITRRGALFRASDGQELNLGQYRARSGEALPRVVLLIDEFHVLFNQDDKIASGAADLMDRIVKQGRAFGVHVILASQTLSGASGMNKATMGLIPIRIALQSGEADSRVLLADDNPDARLLTRPGEGLLNTKGGLRDANSRFQAAYTAPSDRIQLLKQLRSLADRRGMTQRPVVFEGRETADVDELAASAVGKPHTRSLVEVPLGLPLTLDPPVCAGLRREPGGNLLLVMPDDTAYGPLVVAMASLLRSGAKVTLLDYGSIDAPWEQQLLVLAGAGLETRRRHGASAALSETCELVRERQALDEVSAAPVVLVLSALHRARELDTGSADGPEPEDLAFILREGPDVGVHVIVWCDKPVSIGRRLTGGMLREFSLRALGPMGKDDSFALIDSDAAATLNPAQIVLDDHDRVVTVRARRVGLPDSAAVLRLVGR